MNSYKTKHALRLCAVASLSLLPFTQSSWAWMQPDSKTPRQPSEVKQPVDPKMPRDDAAWNERGVLLVPTSWIMGTNIVTTSDEKLGSVDDLLISPRHHRVAYVLLSRGGVAGIGSKTYAVPYSAFTWNDEKRKLVLPITKEMLESAPAIDGDDWKRLTEKERSTPLFEYYKVPVTRRDWTNDASVHAELPDADGAAGRDKSKVPQPPRDEKDHKAPRPGDEWSQTALNQWPLLKCSQIKGQTLLSDQGSELGTMKDVIVDCNSGRIAFGSVGFGGVLGFGDKMVLIPWDMFRVNTEGKVYATTLDPDMVKAAPKVDYDDWRQLREEKYAPGIYRHFNREGMWLDQRDSSRVKTTRNDRYPDYDLLYSNGTTVDVSGLVMLVEQTRPMKDMPEVTSVAVTTDNKDTYVVHLAPDWYLKDQGLMIKAGDRVSFKGRWVMIDGKKYFMASNVTPADGKVWVLRRDDGTRAWTWR